MTESPQPTPQQIEQYERNKVVQPPNALKWLLGKLGPGFITGAADDDPSGHRNLCANGRSLWV